MESTNEQNNTKTAIVGNNVLAVVNYNAIGSWLEPYIGMTLKIIKKGINVTWFEMNYGYIKKCKINSSFFNYC